MTAIEDLARRNSAFALHGFTPGLTINAWGKVMVISCVDSRVDPAYVLGLAPGEAWVIRNVGGRVTPSTLRAMRMLAEVGRANIDTAVPGTRTLLVLQHTDCGMTDLAAFPDLLAEYFEVPADELAGKSVDDPVGGVRVDVEILLDHQHAPDTVVAGMVYDVDTGRVDVVVPPTPLASS